MPSGMIQNVPIASFDLAAAGVPVPLLVVDVTAVQAAGTPTPSSPLAITGWAGANVTRAGKNLFDLAGWLTRLSRPYIVDGNGYYIFTINGSLRSNPFVIPKRAGYVLSWDVGPSTTATNLRVELTRSGGGSQNINISGTGSVAVNDTWDFIGLRYSSSGTVQIKLQLELASSATAYAPYAGDVYAFDWSGSAGTIYGGTLNVTTGVLTVTRAEVDLSTLAWGSTSWGGLYAAISGMALPADSSTVYDGMAENYIMSSYSAVASSTGVTDALAVNLRGGNPTVYLRKGNAADVVGGLFVYNLATPVEYQLTAQEVDTLLGANNIWADTGDVDTLIYNVLLTLITDRTAADVAYARMLGGIQFADMTAEQQADWLAGLKGTYNASDLNRVGAAVLLVAGLVNSIGYNITVTGKHDWTMTDIPTSSQMSDYLADLLAIRAALTIPAGTPAVPSSMSGLDFNKANNIEKILLIVDELVQRITASFVYSGQPASGQIWEEFTNA